MARAFVAYPEEYVRVLAGETFSNPDRNLIIAHTAYGCDYPEEFHAEALAAMEGLSGDPLRLNEQEWVWGEALRVRLEKGIP
jgi:hypothetical protein